MSSLVQATYTVPELAELAGRSQKVIRGLLRRAGFPPPGRKGSTEYVALSDLRTRAPGFFDSLVEARALRQRLGEG